MFQLNLTPLISPLVLHWSLIICLMQPVNAGAVNVQKLTQAYQAALSEYQKKDKDFYKSIDILRKAEVQKIIEKKPEGMSEQVYVNILNDYGFFLSLTGRDNLYVEPNYCEAKTVLEKVKKIAPNRIPIYLNLADLYWNIFLTESYIGSHNAGFIRRYEFAACVSEDQDIRTWETTPSYPYRAKQLYLEYARRMELANKGDKIPKRLSFILDNDKMFVITRYHNRVDDENDFTPCQDYINALNRLPESERSYCNRDISKADTPFVKRNWDDVDRLLRKRFYDEDGLGGYDSRDYAYWYKGKRYFVDGSYLRGEMRRRKNILIHCQYKYLDLQNKHYMEFIIPHGSCIAKGE